MTNAPPPVKHTYSCVARKNSLTPGTAPMWRVYVTVDGRVTLYAMYEPEQDKKASQACGKWLLKQLKGK